MPVASGSSSRPPPTPSTSNMKPTLSASQKKANHIQSEQKRRANIRRGYEALCEVVPTLREALAQPAATEPRKRRRTNGVSEEKVAQADGRAGPKSENVVLAKTIDHIHGLLAETEALRARLAAVDSPNRDPNEVRLWERKWDGGHKRGSDDEDDGDSDE
ncbi:hypothetical protein CYLTODRAFT_351786 [Cylindrobasidium torrendii FP15055 ss-10]|uniref:BHLH domain-containing protein n=1 Tax=Cylindrobasidium torrendii FP15055 ss-10 TaxID=1314674 RepID=A0A0D7BDF6_9AGAR|nr:hypothetical protein CYLTODRAFT_351786 [Cylindrobasidium torrendii FP15055 ss-10]